MVKDSGFSDLYILFYNSYHIKFNILNYNGKIVLIDLSHAISSESAEAHNLLKRDIEKIIKFFRKKGIKKNLNEVLRYIKEK